MMCVMDIVVLFKASPRRIDEAGAMNDGPAELIWSPTFDDDRHRIHRLLEAP